MSDNADANTQATSSVAAAGNFDVMVPTIDEEAPTSAETLNTVEGDTEQKSETPETPEKEAEAEAEKPEPFHKHPRFQQITAKNKELETQLQEMQKQLELLAKPESKAPDADPYEARQKELQAKLDEGDIGMSEWATENQKIMNERTEAAIQQALSRQKHESEVNQIQQKFLQENADFIDLRDSGELQAMIDKNPVHDNLSAYFALKSEEAVAKAIKETEERVRKEFASKRNANSLSSNTAHVPTSGKDPALSNTKKYGGMTQVLANRLKALRGG